MNPTNPRLPAEWEPQAGVMLTWPHAGTDWFEQLDRTLPVFVQIGAALSQDGLLLNVCHDRLIQGQVLALLEQAGAISDNLRFALTDSNDTWARDHGTITVLSDAGAILHDFTFDGWGGKFDASLDTAINRALAEQGVFGHAPMLTHALVLEGGALETDGQGTLLATRSSVLNRNRNPLLSAEAIEQQLRQHLGIKRFLWLEHGQLAGDDTDAHIDVLARFGNPRTILYSTAPAGDPDHAQLAAMREQLQQLRDSAGQPYRLIALPWPGEHHASDGRRLPASYANFLISNRSVLLPVYGVDADRQAIDILQGCFPDRRLVAIDCRPIIEQNGSLHCLTMQFPAAVPLVTPVTCGI